MIILTYYRGPSEWAVLRHVKEVSMRKRTILLILAPVAAAVLYAEMPRISNWLRWQYIDQIGGLA